MDSGANLTKLMILIAKITIQINLQFSVVLVKEKPYKMHEKWNYNFNL